jgi:hypothetical protein
LEPVADDELQLLARRLRARAVEILAIAETMTDPDARSQMLEIVTRYERLAERVEMEAGEA